MDSVAAACSLCAALLAKDDEEREVDLTQEHVEDEELQFAVCLECDAMCNSHRSKLDARMVQAFADAAELERAGEGKEAAETRRQRWKRVRSAAGALKKHPRTLPTKQFEEYRDLLRSRFGTDNIDDPHVQWLCSFEAELDGDEVNRVLAHLSAKEQQMFVGIWKAHWYQLFKSQGAAIPRGWHSHSVPIQELLKRRESKARFQCVLGLPTPVYRFDKKAELWKEAPPDSVAAADTVEKDRLVVVSFNVLFDLYHGLKDLIHTHKRTPYVLNMLRELDADIIGLQEVTPPFLNCMLEEDWVKENYFISEHDIALSKTKATKKDLQSTIYPSGQLLLSKLPFQASVHAFSGYKRLICGEFIINGRHLCVPVVHLTSEKAGEAGSRRATQLSTIVKAMLGEEIDRPDMDSIVMGDFNFSDDEVETKYIPEEFVDAWLALRPDEEGFTFNPSTNLTAALTSQSKLCRRFDRILIRSPGENRVWRPVSIEMIGTEAIVWREKRNTKPERSGAADESALGPQETEDLIAEFARDDSREVYEFPPTLNNFQRMLVHRIASRMGLQHYSAGEESKGTRCVVLAKKGSTNVSTKQQRKDLSTTQPSPPSAASAPPPGALEEEVAEQEFRIHPSDHFGLVCTLQFGQRCLSPP